MAAKPAAKAMSNDTGAGMGSPARITPTQPKMAKKATMARKVKMRRPLSAAGVYPTSQETSVSISVSQRSAPPLSSPPSLLPARPNRVNTVCRTKRMDAGMAAAAKICWSVDREYHHVVITKTSFVYI